MINILKITVLIDNIADDPLLSEWGLSILIEADDKKILLDTGASDAFAQNADTLGIMLEDIDVGVLSHAHYDHADGLDTFFGLNHDAIFMLRKGNNNDCCYSIKKGTLEYIGIRKGIVEDNAERIRYVDGLCELYEGIWLVPHHEADYTNIALRNSLYVVNSDKRYPDDFSHEQSLVIETVRGLVIFNSCSHTGMANILTDVRESLNRDDFYAYVGGLHLYKFTDAELNDICKEIKNSGVDHIFTGHCTGEHAYSILRAELGNRINLFYSGFNCNLIELA